MTLQKTLHWPVVVRRKQTEDGQLDRRWTTLAKPVQTFDESSDQNRQLSLLRHQISPIYCTEKNFLDAGVFKTHEAFNGMVILVEFFRKRTF